MQHNTLPVSNLWFPRTSDSVTSFPGHDGNPRLGPHTRSPILNVRGLQVGTEPVVESATSSTQNERQHLPLTFVAFVLLVYKQLPTASFWQTDYLYITKHTIPSDKVICSICLYYTEPLAIGSRQNAGTSNFLWILSGFGFYHEHRLQTTCTI